MTLLNPVLLVEVLSPSTRSYDRGEKFHHYRQIPSLRAYVLISAEKREVEIISIDGDRWAGRLVREGEFELESIGCTLSIDDIYSRVQWEDALPAA